MRLIPLILLTLPLTAQQFFISGLPSLTEVLSLTTDQAQKISALLADYDRSRVSGNSRMFQLNSDLASNFAQPSMNAAQIGADYAEAEAIRRDLAAKQASYRAQVRALLTLAQQARYQGVLNSITLQPLLSEAGCAFLEDTRSSFGYTSFLLGAVVAPTQLVRSGDFLFTGLPVFLPYIPPAPGPTFCGSPMFPLALREYLNVTDPQVASIAQASADYNDVNQRRQARIAEVQIEIRDETAKAQPDPVALGLRYVEIQLLSTDLQNQAARLRERARAALTGEQAVRLKTLDDLAAGQPALNTLQGCDLLVVPPGSQGFSSTTGYIFTVDPLTGNPAAGSSCRVS